MLNGFATLLVKFRHFALVWKLELNSANRTGKGEFRNIRDLVSFSRVVSKIVILLFYHLIVAWFVLANLQLCETNPPLSAKPY